MALASAARTVSGCLKVGRFAQGTTSSKTEPYSLSRRKSGALRMKILPVRGRFFMALLKSTGCNNAVHLPAHAGTPLKHGDTEGRAGDGRVHLPAHAGTPLKHNRVPPRWIPAVFISRPTPGFR